VQNDWPLTSQYDYDECFSASDANFMLTTLSLKNSDRNELTYLLCLVKIFLHHHYSDGWSFDSPVMACLSAAPLGNFCASGMWRLLAVSL
jgi:hypothetical protein